MSAAPTGQKAELPLVRRKKPQPVTRLEREATMLLGRRTPADARSTISSVRERQTEFVINRYAWGKIVASSLAPKFTSRQFANQFLSPLPQHAEDIFDPVRFKKILQRLCRENVIEMSQRGRGGIPAAYYVVPQAPKRPERLAATARKTFGGGAPRNRRKRASITDETRKLVKKLVGESKTGARIAVAAGISRPSVQKVKAEFGLVRVKKPRLEHG